MSFREKPKRLTAGKMDKQISYVEVDKNTQDAWGQPLDVPGFETSRIGPLWASVEPLQGREHFSADEHMADVTHRIRHLYVGGIKREYFVKLGSRRFEVLYFMDQDERQFEMEVLVKERLP